MTPRHAATVFACASVLLSYPDDSYADDLAAVALRLESLPRRLRQPLAEACHALAALPKMTAEARYVETFDLARGRSMHLTYHRHGDRRDRGAALAALVDTYRSAGLCVAPGELPDYLPALLELAAVHPVGVDVLTDHRAAVEALRTHLRRDEDAAPFTTVLDAVLAALGPLPAARRLRGRTTAPSAVPPPELVGRELPLLAPYGPAPTEARRP